MGWRILCIFLRILWGGNVLPLIGVTAFVCIFIGNLMFMVSVFWVFMFLGKKRKIYIVLMTYYIVQTVHRNGIYCLSEKTETFI